MIPMRPAANIYISSFYEFVLVLTVIVVAPVLIITSLIIISRLVIGRPPLLRTAFRF
jgi:hypothetical protein